MRVVVLYSHVCCVVVVCVCVCVACVRACVCVCVCPFCRFEVNFSSGLWPITQAISCGLCQVRISRLLLPCARSRGDEVSVQVTVGSAKYKNRACLEAEIRSRSGTPRKQQAACGVFALHNEEARSNTPLPPLPHCLLLLFLFLLLLFYFFIFGTCTPTLLRRLETLLHFPHANYQALCSSVLLLWITQHPGR